MFDAVLILVIDDIDTNLFMLSTLLKREGFSVITAGSGPEGRKLASERKPDLILLDIIMPEENGFQTCEFLKKDSETAAIPIVFLSALEDTESKIKGLAIGAADFITKPFMKEEVLVRIRGQIRLRRHQTLMVENLGTMLEAYGNGENNHDSVCEEVDIAEGIHGFLCARATDTVDGPRAIKSLRYLIPRVATPLLSPDEAVILINYVLRRAFPAVSAIPAAYCVCNRNASRLSITLAGEVSALFSDTPSSASFCGKMGDALASQEVPFLQRMDYPAKPGSRICVYLAAIERDDQKEAFRSLFLSSASKSVEDQLIELADFLDNKLLLSADRLFVFETT